MTLHFFHRYDRLSASFRARCECYSPFLIEAGLSFRFHSLLDSRYLIEKYANRRVSVFRVLLSYAKRLHAILRLKKSDIAIVHLELFPYLPGIFEAYLKRKGVSLIYDFDDPFFHFYDQHRSWIIRLLFGEKIKRIIRNADCIIAGNEYLSSYAATEHKDSTIIPSVVDLLRYKCIKTSSQIDASTPFTIGWIGTPSTAHTLLAATDAIATFCYGRIVKLILVGSGPVEINGIEAEIRPWSESTEIESILEFDVGIMPLPDNPFNRGKGGMKIMQYMACGIPAIASPVGFNSEIIKHGENGFLASSSEEWIRYLEVLYENPGLRSRLGAIGRQTIEREYCLQITGPKFLDLVTTTYVSRQARQDAV